MFEKKKKEVMREKQDFDILLDGELDRLVKKGLDEFKKESTAVLTVSLEAFYQENKSLSSKDLNSIMENYVIDEVKNAYNNWRAKEDGKLAPAFESIWSRFIGKINETVDALFKFSKEYPQPSKKG